MKNVILILVVVGGLWASTGLYTVKETERAIILQFGQIVNPDVQPGLGWKSPWPFQELRTFDSRLQLLDTRETEYLTDESKILIVDAYAVWRISDVHKFYNATDRGNVAKARNLLTQRITQGLKNKVSERTLYEVVSGDRDELMRTLTEEVALQAAEEMGIEIVDIRVKRVDYPDRATDAIYERMRTERQQEAAQYRAEGNEQAEKIRADADKQRTVLLAEAYRESETLRGEGDALAAGTYSNAYGSDREFYEFYRSLSAYRNTFSDESDVLVLEPEGEFFRYMKGSTRR